MTQPDLPLKKQPTYSCGKEREPKNSLSYNISSLKWDTRHQENEQKMYCYCGKFGDWYVDGKFTEFAVSVCSEIIPNLSANLSVNQIMP